MNAVMQAAEGTVQAPPSKSVTHRAYLLAAQSDTPCDVAHPLLAGDPDTTLDCLHSLGARLTLGDEAIRFDPAALRPPAGPLDCRNAGTTLRLLTATTARLPVGVVFTGDASLSTRPNGPLLAALHSLGARIDGGPTLPFTVRGPITPGVTTLPSSTSSQFGSALLLSLPLLDGPSQLIMRTPLASRPYLDVTLDVARRFGLQIEVDDPSDGATRFHVPGGDTPHLDRFEVEGDWSSAAFPLLAAAVTGGDVTVRGVHTSSVQGDRAIMDHLQRFGVQVDGTKTQVRAQGGPLRSPGVVDITDTPDLFPALAVLAAFSEGVTTFTGGTQLRHKESDRIHAMAHALSALGTPVKQTQDGLRVEGGHPLHPATLDARGDHRIHMALRIAALAVPGTTVSDADSTGISHPTFEADLACISGGVA